MVKNHQDSDQCSQNPPGLDRFVSLFSGHDLSVTGIVDIDQTYPDIRLTHVCAYSFIAT